MKFGESDKQASQVNENEDLLAQVENIEAATQSNVLEINNASASNVLKRVETMLGDDIDHRSEEHIEHMNAQRFVPRQKMFESEISEMDGEDDYSFED